MKRKLLIALGLALMLTVLFAAGAMAADKLVISNYATTTVGFTSPTPNVVLKSSSATLTSGVTFSAKPVKFATIDPATGVLTGVKAGKVTVTASYVNEAGKTIKGTKSVKIVANTFSPKLDRKGWKTGYGIMYYTTKKLYYSADGQYLNAEMAVYNYYGGRVQVKFPATEAYAQIADVRTNTFVSTTEYGVKYLNGFKMNKIVSNKGKFVVLFQFPLSTNPGLRDQDLRAGNFRVGVPGAAEYNKRITLVR